MTINWSPKRDRGAINWAPKVETITGVPVVTTTEAPRAFAGVPYSFQLVVSGTPPFTFSIESGTLPTGLGLSSTGVIIGTPTGSTSSFVVRVANAAGSTTVGLTVEVQTAPTVQTVTLAPGAAALKVGETTDLVATVVDQYGAPVKDMSGVALAAPGSVASGAMVGLTDAAGRVTLRVTALAAGVVSIVARFGGVLSEPSMVTVTVPIVAHLQGAAFASLLASSSLSVAVVKGVQIRLHNKAGVPRSSISDVRIRWWDGDGEVLTYSGTGAIDPGGWMLVDLDAATALPVGGEGRLELYKQGASFTEDMYFASRLAVVDLRAGQ